MPPAKDLTGQRFHMVTAIRRVGKDKQGGWRWLCRCDCGTEFIRSAGFLPLHKSCGCIKSSASAAARGRKNHGLSNHPEFHLWIGIKRRCSPGNKYSRYYYDRGIRICKKWEEDFTSFLEDMGPRPSPDHSIDRIDNEGNYEPGNCRWALADQQANNRRTTVFLTLNGETLSVSQWAKKYNISVTTVRSRLYRGLSLEEALKPTNR